MALKLFTLPADTQVPFAGNPAGDMNGVVACLNDAGYQFSICNKAWAGGAPLDGTSDCTAAIQACMNAAAPFGAPVLIPAGVQFRVSQLTWNAGQILQGVYGGTYPGGNARFSLNGATSTTILTATFTPGSSAAATRSSTTCATTPRSGTASPTAAPTTRSWGTSPGPTAGPGSTWAPRPRRTGPRLAASIPPTSRTSLTTTATRT